MTDSAAEKSPAPPPAAAPEAPHPALPVLPYVDWATRRGITFETGERSVSFVIPPPPFWLRGEVIAPLVVFLVILGPQLYTAVVQQRMREMLLYGAVGGVFLLGAMLAARVRRPLAIELTPDALHLRNVRPLFAEDQRPVQSFTFSRSEVYDVRYVTHSRNIVVRARMRDMVEFRPSQEDDIVRWIAEELRRVLGLPA